jgi:superfamily I DNA/RNA helicase
MKESFRSTKPITELAMNVLYRLQPPENNPDHKEMVTRGLIERTKRNGIDWWTVRFNQIDGPKPTFRQYTNLDQEFEAIAHYCRELIEVDGVQPSDICILYHNDYVKYRLEKDVAPTLSAIGVELSIQIGCDRRSAHVREILGVMKIALRVMIWVSHIHFIWSTEGE